MKNKFFRKIVAKETHLMLDGGYGKIAVKAVDGILKTKSGNITKKALISSDEDRFQSMCFLGEKDACDVLEATRFLYVKVIKIKAGVPYIKEVCVWPTESPSFRLEGVSLKEIIYDVK